MPRTQNFLPVFSPLTLRSAGGCATRAVVVALVIAASAAFGAPDCEQLSVRFRVGEISIGTTYKAVIERFPNAQFHGDLGNLRFWELPGADRLGPVVVAFDIGTPEWDCVAIMRPLTQARFVDLEPVHAELTALLGVPAVERGHVQKQMLRSDKAEQLVVRIIKPLGVDRIFNTGLSTPTNHELDYKGMFLTQWDAAACGVSLGVIEHAWLDRDTRQVIGHGFLLFHLDLPRSRGH